MTVLERESTKTKDDDSLIYEIAEEKRELDGVSKDRGEEGKTVD
jgi:hypothetical protein